MTSIREGILAYAAALESRPDGYVRANTKISVWDTKAWAVFHKLDSPNRCRTLAHEMWAITFNFFGGRDIWGWMDLEHTQEESKQVYAFQVDLLREAVRNMQD